MTYGMKCLDLKIAKHFLSVDNIEAFLYYIHVTILGGLEIPQIMLTH